MYALVRKILETYLREKRVITLSDIDADTAKNLSTKDAIFVTLYREGRVIASSGRIVCKKENTLYECIDNTLLCLKDPRFTLEIQDVTKLGEIRIRTDRFAVEHRRVLREVNELDVTREWLILLSQNLGVLSVILPHMIHVDPTASGYFTLACAKAGIDSKTLWPADYVLYGLTTVSESDFE